MIERHSKMVGLKIRLANCDKWLGSSERCPNCGYFHLRQGYCQALDPNYVSVTKVSVTDLSVTDLSVTCQECGSEFEPKRSTAKFCSDVCRKKASRK